MAIHVVYSDQPHHCPEGISSGKKHMSARLYITLHAIIRNLNGKTIRTIFLDPAGPISAGGSIIRNTMLQLFWLMAITVLVVSLGNGFLIRFRLKWGTVI